MNKHKIEGKNILELGSGVGLTGLTVIDFCALKTYNFSDCHSIVLETLAENVRLNLLNNKRTCLWKEISSGTRVEFEQTNIGKAMQVNVKNLKWEDIDKLCAEQMEVDIVIAADVLYDKSTFESLACGLKELMIKTVNYTIMAATVRNESTLLEFLNLLGKN